MNNRLVLETKYEVQKVSHDEVSVNVTNEKVDNSSALKSLPILKRQGKILDSSEDTKQNPFTPTNLLTPTNLESELSFPSTPISVPCVNIRTDGESSKGILVRSVCFALCVLISNSLCTCTYP